MSGDHSSVKLFNLPARATSRSNIDVSEDQAHRAIVQAQVCTPSDVRNGRRNCSGPRCSPELE